MPRKLPTTRTSANPIWVTRSRDYGTLYQPGPGRHFDRRDLCLHGARGGHDLPGHRPPELRPGRDGDVLDLHLLAIDAVGRALLVVVPDHAGDLVCRRH